MFDLQKKKKNVKDRFYVKCKVKRHNKHQVNTIYIR